MHDICKLAKILSSETRLRLIKILSNEKRLSAVEVYNIYKRLYDDVKHRESIYRELEKLVDVKILTKEYDKRMKKLVYKLHTKEIIIDLLNLQIKIVEFCDV
jgi:Fe2+ or Zn2+ uptake regulation protein